MGQDNQRQGELVSQYRTLLNSSTDGFFINLRGRVHYANPAFQRLLRAKSEEDLLGRNIFDVIHPSSHEAVKARIRDIKIGPDPVKPLEEKYVRLDGTVVDVEVTAVPVIQDGEPAILVAVRDISERKEAERARLRLEEQLRQSQKMEALGTLAGGVAHDFNNILSAIVGNTELAAQSLLDPERTRTHLNGILTAATRARGLTQQVLAFSRRQPSRLHVLDLGQAVSDELALLRAAVPASVTMTDQLVQGPCPVLADATQIHQVVLNLCNNAWQALAGRSGNVSISVERRPVSTEADGGPGEEAVLTVTDDGPGIDQTIMDRIFDPFFTTKSPGYGTGLGLSVVHGIAKAHGARIRCESKVGKGTTFGIHFPIASSAVRTAPVDTAHAPRGRGQAILLVDDELQLVKLGEQLLQAQGYRVTGATSAREALTKLKAGGDAYDLLITDLKMPELTGLELAEAVRQLVVDLPIILISGFVSDDVAPKAEAIGIERVLRKPLESKELFEAVAGTLALAGG